MVTAIAILGGLCLLSVGAVIYLTYMLFITTEELREAEREKLDVPSPVLWDDEEED